MLALDAPVQLGQYLVMTKYRIKVRCKLGTWYEVERKGLFFWNRVAAFSGFVYGNDTASRMAVKELNRIRELESL